MLFSESFLDCECFWSLRRVIGLLWSVSDHGMTLSKNVLIDDRDLRSF